MKNKEEAIDAFIKYRKFIKYGTAEPEPEPEPEETEPSIYSILKSEK